MSSKEAEEYSFSENEISLAKDILLAIQNDFYPKEYKAIFMAGQAIMWDELKNLSSPQVVTDEEISQTAVKLNPYSIKSGTAYYLIARGIIIGMKAMRSKLTNK